MQIPCPAYKLADIVKSRQSDVIPTFTQAEEKNVELEPTEDTKSVESPVEIESQSDIETEIPKSLIQEQKISMV